MVFRGGSRNSSKGGGGSHLKTLRRAEAGAENVWVFRVKNHDFTPKNHIFFNFRGGGGGGYAPPGSAPGFHVRHSNIFRLHIRTIYVVSIHVLYH